jgi:integrase
MSKTEKIAVLGASCGRDAGREAVGQGAIRVLTSLADVLAQMSQTDRADRKQVEARSALRRLAEVLRRSLNDIPADPAALRELMAQANPAAQGISKKRWSRIRSLTLWALRDCGLDPIPGRDTGGRSDAWTTAMQALPTQALRYGLSTFASYCTRLRIDPDTVTPATFDSFYDALSRKSLWRNPTASHRSAVRNWNRAVATAPGWSQVVIPIDQHPRYYSLEWSSFPVSYVEDIEACLSRCSVGSAQDELDDDYFKPSAPSTIELRRRQLRQLSSALVHIGFPLDQLTTLSVLVEPENAKRALKWMRQRGGDKKTKTVAQLAWALAMVARHWVGNEAHSVQLLEWAKNLSGKPQGMTARNRDRLRQFDHKSNVLELLNLPARIVAQAQRTPASLDSPSALDVQARRVMYAVAVEILLLAPMRVRNLTNFDYTRHLVQFGRGPKSSWHIVIPGEETKNGQPLELSLPANSVALIKAYIDLFRPLLCAVPSPYLFPARDGGPRDVIAFSRSISMFVSRETGINMHAHLFRHLAGKLHLDANPTDIETVRRMLGHRSTTTTLNYYTGQRTNQAYREYDKTLARLRQDIDPLAAAQTGRRGASR